MVCVTARCAVLTVTNQCVPDVSGTDRKRTAGSACLVAANATPVCSWADAQVWQASRMRRCTRPATQPSLNTSVFPHQTLHTSSAYTCHALLGLASCSEASVQRARAAAARWARIAAMWRRLAVLRMPRRRSLRPTRLALTGTSTGSALQAQPAWLQHTPPLSAAGLMRKYGRPAACVAARGLRPNRAWIPPSFRTNLCTRPLHTPVMHCWAWPAVLRPWCSVHALQRPHGRMLHQTGSFGNGCFGASTMCRQRKHPRRQDEPPVNRHTDTKHALRPYTRRKQ